MSGEHLILNHWREFQPTLVRDLEKSGELDQLIESLANRVAETKAGLIEQGLDWYQADELVRPMWQLPDETVEPVASEPALSAHQATLPAIATPHDPTVATGVRQMTLSRFRRELSSLAVAVHNDDRD